MQLRLRPLRIGMARVRQSRYHTTASIRFRRSRFGLTGQESILVLAPHCDDETLGAGALLYEAVQKGCRVQVAFITNGDGFRYAAHRQYKRLRVSWEKQMEFARLRQRESLRALSMLGVAPQNVAFLGYPDRGLQALWNDFWEPTHPYRSPFTGASYSPYENSLSFQTPYCGRAVVDDLCSLIRKQAPTHLIVPHNRDAHGDHTATFCFAMHALAELNSNGERLGVQVLKYLVHRGTWPHPRGFHPRYELQPPISFAGMPEKWLSLPASNQAIAAKYRAVRQYRSQLNLLSRFLHSFIRKSELFSQYEPTLVRSVPSGTVYVDGQATEWPEGLGYLPDPVRDTITRNVERGADVRSIAVCADPGYLFLRMEMHGRVVDEVRYTIRIMTCGIDRRRIVMRLKVPEQVMVRQGKRWIASDQIICRCRGRVIELAIPRVLLDAAEQVILGAETRYRQIMVDRTAWEVLSLPPAGAEQDAVLFASAARQDLPAIAEVFVAAFHAEILALLGAEPAPSMVAHMLALLHEAEPQALLTARLEGSIVGYAYAPKSLKQIWRTAFSSRHIWDWFINWILGRYKIRFRAVRTLLLDKYYFVRSALRDQDRVEHRILSVGVVPAAQRRHIATKLVQLALHRFVLLGADRVRLEVRPENSAAVRVYSKLGFKITGSMSDSRGEWWIMIKELMPDAVVSGAVPDEKRSDPEVLV